MTALRITNFGGIVPRLANRALGQNGARSAANCTLLSGELRPMRKPKKVYEPALASALKSIFRVDDTTFFCWPTEFVQMVRAPIEGEARFCYTGDGIPKVTTKAIGTPVNSSGTPSASLSLGIPSPIVAPFVGTSGGVSAVNASRLYAYTFYSDNNEESSFSPVSSLLTGKVDASWNITGMEPSPANSGTVTAITKTATTVTLTLNTNHYLRVDDLVTIAGVAGMTDVNGAWNIASVPGNSQITINLVTSQTYTSGGAWTRAVPWGNCKKRLYRTSSGTKADFQLVAIDITTTTYADSLTDLQIPGDSAVSDGWVPPPSNMVGLVSLSNGVLAGYYGNTVCMSEPYQPHAWPTKYRKKMSGDIVGIAAFDTNLGVATTGLPVVLAGSDPDQMLPIKHSKPLPCVARASVCGVGDGVVYASKNGLVKIDISSASMYTSELFGPEEWNKIVPASIKAAFDGTKIYLSTVAGIIYIFNTIEGGALTTTNQYIDGMYVDTATSDLFFAYQRKVNVLESFTSAPMTADWWGREFVLDKPVNFGAVKLEYDMDYAIDAAAAIAQEQADAIASNVTKITTIGGRGGIGASAINARPINGSFLDPIPSSQVSVSFSFYAKEKLIYSAVLQNGVGAVMPSGYKSDTFSIRIQGNTQVKAVVIADTPKNLKDA
ncbi:ubiquitin-activating E1 FCCH domain-containing protein [Undibacterium sp. Rencai35W]|uniref:ubiquitin-activating E1 FCCH domain-containing protein n=1 Tax=Undibacterium sp. Rencai35W TaxID=3413046 RepID=UPI003BF11486